MARQRKMTPERRSFINNLLKHYHPNDAQNIQEMLKDLPGYAGIDITDTRNSHDNGIMEFHDFCHLSLDTV